MTKILLLLIGLVTIVISCSESDDPRGKVRWIESYALGTQQANSTGKPIMLYFSATWCGVCRKLAKRSLSNKKVVEASSQLVNIHVDIDEDETLGNQYGILGVPTIIFLDQSGTKIKESSEMWRPEFFAEEINSIAKNYHR